MSIIIQLYLYFYLPIEMIFVELVSLDLYDVRKHISYQQNQSFNLSLPKCPKFSTMSSYTLCDVCPRITGIEKHNLGRPGPT